MAKHPGRRPGNMTDTHLYLSENVGCEGPIKAGLESSLLEYRIRTLSFCLSECQETGSESSLTVRKLTSSPSDARILRPLVPRRGGFCAMAGSFGSACKCTREERKDTNTDDRRGGVFLGPKLWKLKP